MKGKSIAVNEVDVRHDRATPAFLDDDKPLGRHRHATDSIEAQISAIHPPLFSRYHWNMSVFILVVLSCGGQQDDAIDARKRYSEECFY